MAPRRPRAGIPGGGREGGLPPTRQEAKSSGLTPSRNSRKRSTSSSSWVSSLTATAASSSTVSSAKIGVPRRAARAMASDGRLDTEHPVPFRVIWISA